MIAPAGPTRDPARSCHSKRRYDDEKSAKRAAGKCYDARGVRLRTYGCWECGGYHLTHTRVDQR